MEQNKNYRIRTNINEDTVLNINLNRDFDFLEMLSVKISQEKVYNVKSSNYGVVVGRVVANDGFGVPNAKVSIFIQRSENDNDEISSIYPYSTVLSKDKNDIRYNLLPNVQSHECLQSVGTFPSKRELLDNDVQIEVYEKYWKYTTVSNNSGDYMIFGVPTGDYTLHVDIDLSDIGILSQKPSDFYYKGFNKELFESARQFKKSTNLDSLAQIVSENKTVHVYPFWGDTESNDNIAITRCDVNIPYKFEPTCIFIGSIITDIDTNSVDNKCVGNRNIGDNGSLVTKGGTIEIIRKTPTGSVEELRINGNELINGDGVWCYQIPMNLDYITTDEFGDIVPSSDINKGIPTRANVRLRVSLDNGDVNDLHNYRLKYLIPNNNSDDLDSNYIFGSSTPNDQFRDLYWDDVYSVKNYIPRIQKIDETIQNTNGKNCNKNNISIKYTNFSNQNNPIPFNKMNICKKWWVGIFCTLLHLVLQVITVWNDLMSTLKFESWKIQFQLNDDDTGISYTYSPTKANKQGDLITTKIDKYILDEYKIIDLGFYNDWLNGTLYFPVLNFIKGDDGNLIFCNCENKTNKDLQIYDNGRINKEITDDNYINNSGTTLETKIYGICKNVKNNDGYDIYYYSSDYKTDIILLGNINNNMSLLNKLPSTTHNLPPIFHTYKNSEDGKVSILGEIEKTPMDWLYDDNDSNGLFFNFGCLETKTKLKSCVNVKRICELGVGQDVQHKDEKPDGYILNNDIFDNDGRLMFTMLNSNGLVIKKRDKKTNYYINEHKYSYHYGFDGNLNNLTYDEINNDYLNFIKNNSFYFYFGLHYGKTAIDEFRNLFNQSCPSIGELKMDYIIDYNNSSGCSPTGSIKISGISKTPYTVILNDGHDENVLYDNISDVYITKLSNDKEYGVTIIDSDNNKANETISLSISGFGYTVSNTSFKNEVIKDNNGEWLINGVNNLAFITISDLNYCGGYISDITKIENFYDNTKNSLTIKCNGVVNNNITNFNVNFDIIIQKTDKTRFDINKSGSILLGVQNDKVTFSVSTPYEYNINITETCINGDYVKGSETECILFIPNKIETYFKINDVRNVHLKNNTVNSKLSHIVSNYDTELNNVEWYKLIKEDYNIGDSLQILNNHVVSKITKKQLLSNQITAIDDFVDKIAKTNINNSIHMTNNIINGNIEIIDYKEEDALKNINVIYDSNGTYANSDLNSYDETNFSNVTYVQGKNVNIFTKNNTFDLKIKSPFSDDSYVEFVENTEDSGLSGIYCSYVNESNGNKIPTNAEIYDINNDVLSDIIKNYINIKTIDRNIYGDITINRHSDAFNTYGYYSLYGNVYGGLPLKYDKNAILSKFSDIKSITKGIFEIGSEYPNYEVTTYTNDVISFKKYVGDLANISISTIHLDHLVYYAKVMSILIRLFRYNDMSKIYAFDKNANLSKMQSMANDDVDSTFIIDNDINITNFLNIKRKCNYLDFRLYNFFNQGKYDVGDIHNFIGSILNTIYENIEFIEYNHEYTYYFISEIIVEENNNDDDLMMLDNITIKYPNNLNSSLNDLQTNLKLPCDILLDEQLHCIIGNGDAVLSRGCFGEIDFATLNIDSVKKVEINTPKVIIEQISVVDSDEYDNFAKIKYANESNNIVFNNLIDDSSDYNIRNYQISYDLDTNIPPKLILNEIKLGISKQNTKFDIITKATNGNINNDIFSKYEYDNGKFILISPNGDFISRYEYNGIKDGKYELIDQLFNKKIIDKQIYEDLVRKTSIDLIDSYEIINSSDYGYADVVYNCKDVNNGDMIYFTTHEKIENEGSYLNLYTTFYNKTKNPLDFELIHRQNDETKYIGVTFENLFFDNILTTKYNEENIFAYLHNGVTNKKPCITNIGLKDIRFTLKDELSYFSSDENIYLHVEVKDDYKVEYYDFTLRQPLNFNPNLDINNNGGIIVKPILGGYTTI